MKNQIKDNTDKKARQDPGAWEKLAAIIEKRKRQLAEFLGTKSERLSARGKKVALLFFGIVMGGVSLALITKPFRDSTSVDYSFTRMRHTPVPIPSGEPSDSLFSREDYELLIGYKQTLDSLKKYDPATYHELLKGREGLIDSIDFLIRLYQ